MGWGDSMRLFSLPPSAGSALWLLLEQLGLGIPHDVLAGGLMRELGEQALAQGKALLQAEAASGLVDPAAYAASLRTAIGRDKAAAMAHKAAGRTKEALHCLKRAKIMMQEIEPPVAAVAGS